MRKVNTTVNTGDIITLNGKECRIGAQKRIDGKLKIALHFKITETSGYTEWVTTRELNKRIGR